MLYPGSFVDVSASFAFDNVTYIDSDRRAARFFADKAGVDEIIGRRRLRPNAATWRFISGDYRRKLDMVDQSVGLLVSLYAGFVSEHCTRYLRSEGWLLVNPSHGDVAMASISPEYSLAAVVNSRSGNYTIADRDPGRLSDSQAADNDHDRSALPERPRHRLYEIALRLPLSAPSS